MYDVRSTFKQELFLDCMWDVIERLVILNTGGEE